MTTAKTALMLLVVFAAAFSTVGCSSVQQLALQDRRDRPGIHEDRRLYSIRYPTRPVVPCVAAAAT